MLHKNKKKLLIITPDIINNKFVLYTEKLFNECNIDVCITDIDNAINKGFIEKTKKYYKTNLDKFEAVLVDTYYPDYKSIGSQLHPSIDVDCISYENMGKLYTIGYDQDTICPAVVQAILDVIRYNYKSLDELSGKKIIIYGKGITVGKPLFSILLNYGADVELIHSNSIENHMKNIPYHDLAITGVGKSNFINKNNYMKNCFYIDVGIHYDIFSGKVCGDVDESLYSIDDVLTTITPNGIGKLTPYYLLNNYIKLNNMR